MIATQTTTTLDSPWVIYDERDGTRRLWEDQGSVVGDWTFVASVPYAPGPVRGSVEAFRLALSELRLRGAMLRALQVAGPVRRGAPRQAARGLRRWAIVRTPTLHCMRVE